jgi:hypothetical protein
LRKDLAKKSGFDEEFINKCCLLGPLGDVVEEIKKENSVISKTGSYTIIADDLKCVFKDVRKLSTIRIPHKDLNFIPMGIAIDVEENKNDKGEKLRKKEGSYDLNSLDNDLIQVYIKNTKLHIIPRI